MPAKKAPKRSKKATKAASKAKPKQTAEEARRARELAFRADLNVRAFRAKGLDIYPGRIMVTRVGSFVMHPIDDGDFDQTKERIMGVSIWGPFSEFKPGLVSIDPVNNSRFVAIISGEEYRPPVGVPLIDTWIARADTLRVAKSTGVLQTFGAEKLILPEYQIAAVNEIGRVVRDSAVRLLNAAPEDQRYALLAMATILDIEKPSAKILTAAIRELTASAPAWKKRLSPVMQAGARPTQLDLIESVGCSDDTFRNVREAAGIARPKRGHRYSVVEVDKLIAAARAGNSNFRKQMLDAWAKWGSK